MMWIFLYFASFALTAAGAVVYESVIDRDWGMLMSVLMWLTVAIVIPIALVLTGHQIIYPEWVSAYMSTDQQVTIP